MSIAQVPAASIALPRLFVSLASRIESAAIGIWALAPPACHLYGNRTKIVTLGDVNAAMAQYCISGGDVEMEVRQQKMDD
jgi:hypothetical protein